MRLFRLSLWVVLMASLVMGGAGCTRKPKSITQIPGQEGVKGEVDTTPKGPLIVDNSGKLPSGNNTTGVYTPPVDSTSLKTAEGTGLTSFNPEDFIPNPEFFKANTVYFDFDRSSVRAAERVRVEEVAAVMRSQKNNMVMIEGHCDERGTEEYNRALGERRALAVREYLINLGVEPERVHTISYGEDRPSELGNNESAWAKNRRGEFILLTPKQ